MSNATPVLIFEMWAPVPVFHAIDFDGEWWVAQACDIDGAEAYRVEQRTVCGLPVYLGPVRTDLPDGTRKWGDSETQRGTRLRMDHAGAFGRPCRRCYEVAG